MPPKPPIRLPRKPPPLTNPRVPPPPPTKPTFQSTSKPASNPTSKTAPIRSSSSQAPPTPRYPSGPIRKSVTLLTTIALFLFIRDSVLCIDHVNGSSMSPTLSPHAHARGEKDWVLIRRWAARMDIKRGDVVTFRKPHAPNGVSIKRVVGIEGDRVVLGDQREPVGGGKRIFSYTDGLPTEEGEGEAETDGRTFVVSHGHIWVEGDNWRKSFDSRDFGPVSKALVDGVAIRVWRGWWWERLGDGRAVERKGVETGRSRVFAGEGEGGLPVRFSE